ncbi:MAG: hypothetical protein HY332_10385 [Chloroflexi bacterium]|nr:hypothetical protein [Chloroflexota bacterium]
MATLATLDRTSEELVQSLERDAGVWALAYTPDATAETTPPPYVAGLRPAQLDVATVDRLEDIERRTGSCIVAYEPVPEP